jgi:hypothetical protein
MCTVIFSPRRGGFALGMNRDEQISRETAFPPARHQVGGRQAIFPHEKSGGTWIGINDAGVCLALINWYSVPARVGQNPISRGKVVASLLSAVTTNAVDEMIAKLALKRMNPFRLIGIFRDEKKVMEWRWDRKKLARKTYGWNYGIWISSGFDEPGAQKTRKKVFTKALPQSSSGSLQWLRRLHRSHQLERGPYSICMHRDDAATVSYTEVTMTAHEGTLRYQAGSPCGKSRLVIRRLPLKS